MNQAVSTFSPMPEFSAGTGGFLDPEKIAAGFGIGEGMSVADFGCGAGYLTIIMAEKVGEEGKVWAIDVQENPLDIVKAKARASGLKNIETVRANLEVVGSSRLADKSQDFVLLANILFQSADKKDIVREAVRVLKPGSPAVIIDWKRGVGKFGPPEDRKASTDEMIKIAEGEGLRFKREMDAGAFHFGLFFIKA